MSLQSLRQIQITISDPLYHWFSHEANRRSQKVSDVVRIALEDYARQYDLAQTRTWKLCGVYSVTEPEAAYIVGSDEMGAPITNFAEHVDDVIYKGD